MRSGYTIDECRQAGKAEEFLEALWRRSKLTWRDLLVADHEKIGAEPLPQSRVTSTAIANLTPDEKLLVFRFASRTGRIVGYREGRIYHVLWVDPSLSLYPH